MFLKNKRSDFYETFVEIWSLCPSDYTGTLCFCNIAAPSHTCRVRAHFTCLLFCYPSFIPNCHHKEASSWTEARGVTCTWPLILILYFHLLSIFFSDFSRIICLCNPSFQHLARLQTGSSLLPLSVLFWRAFIFRPIINNTTPDVCSSRLKTAPISHPKIH